MSEPRFAGDMRWIVRWEDAEGYIFDHRPRGRDSRPLRVLQVGVPSWEVINWEDVPEVDET